MKKNIFEIEQMVCYSLTKCYVIVAILREKLSINDIKRVRKRQVLLFKDKIRQKQSYSYFGTALREPTVLKEFSPQRNTDFDYNSNIILTFEILKVVRFCHILFSLCKYCLHLIFIRLVLINSTKQDEGYSSWSV